MILQEAGERLWFFRQTDHALLSGAFAEAWGNEHLPPLRRREATLVAAFRHDDGWASWELAPSLDAEGRPVDFIHIPVYEHVALYRSGIDLVEREDSYAGLVASLHGERLYTRPFYPGMSPRLEKLEGQNLELANEYVEGERARQQRLLDALGEEGVEEDAEETWRLIQVWDRLSLLVCMRPLREGTTQDLPPIAAAAGDVQITARATDSGDLILEPYPFALTPQAFTIAGARTEISRWPDEATYRRDFRGAERFTLSFRCLAG